jgi:amino acid adenylation domain-containing protein
MKHARENPDACALVAGRQRVTYRELHAWSDQVAALLRESGVTAGDFVGAGFHRSAGLIAGLLGIIKAGASYIPIDPGYPEARIAKMIASARLTTVLCDSRSAASFPGVRTIDIGKQPSVDWNENLDGPTADALLYAIFTSGSTGDPKAASVYHSGFSNLLDWYITELSLGAEDRTLVISSPSFDLTQKNLFSPLLTGGILVLDEDGTYDITRILGLIREHRITLVNCTPSAFYPLVEASAGGGYAGIASLRFAVLGGEPISVPRLRAWLEHPSCHAQVVNSYGPTECTDICLFHRMDRNNIDQFSFVPLGREIPNVKLTICGDDMRELPCGETGELCIAGMGVGGGYLFDPEKSASRFVNGFYRTGDLVKQLPCGTYEFRGRADHQVKVNGHRIELGEIEIALGSHPGVREAVVIAADNRLTAHVQGSAGAVDLKSHLSSLLPSYMVPAEFTFVDAFSLTPNGKIDRNALSPAHADAIHRGDDTDGNLETRILALWSEILGKPVADADVNFFDIGGNSIHLAVVHVRLRTMTERDFPITDLFAHPSAKSLAAHLSPLDGGTRGPSAQDRARLARAGFNQFQRPPKR